MSSFKDTSLSSFNTMKWKGNFQVMSNIQVYSKCDTWLSSSQYAKFSNEKKSRKNENIFVIPMRMSLKEILLSILLSVVDKVTNYP